MHDKIVKLHAVQLFDVDGNPGAGLAFYSSNVRHPTAFGIVPRLDGWLPLVVGPSSSRGGARLALGQLGLAGNLCAWTVVAVRRNPTLKEFYTRLRARGKPAKQALTACMRKLLVILNAMLRSRTPWSAPNSLLSLSVAS